MNKYIIIIRIYICQYSSSMIFSFMSALVLFSSLLSAKSTRAAVSGGIILTPSSVCIATPTHVIRVLSVHKSQAVKITLNVTGRFYSSSVCSLCAPTHQHIYIYMQGTFMSKLQHDTAVHTYILCMIRILEFSLFVWISRTWKKKNMIYVEDTYLYGVMMDHIMQDTGRENNVRSMQQCMIPDIHTAVHEVPVYIDKIYIHIYDQYVCELDAIYAQSQTQHNDEQTSSRKQAICFFACEYIHNPNHERSSKGRTTYCCIHV